MRVYIVVRKEDGKGDDDIEKGINMHPAYLDKHKAKARAEILDTHEKKHKRHHVYHIIEKFDVMDWEELPYVDLEASRPS
jgi:hypothetical protein